MHYTALFGPAVRASCLVGLAAAAIACSDSQSATAPLASTTTGIQSTTLGIATARELGRSAGAVYTASNSAGGNAVIAFARAADGKLHSIGSFPTRGTGVGGGVDPLGSQFSVILSAGHAHLYVVNAGSNDITVFAVHRDGTLEWRQRAATHGLMPVSLALHGDRLYVLNAGDLSVSTFRTDEDGTLTLLSGGYRSLPSGAAAPLTIRVASEGRALLVTERTTNRIDLFPLDFEGRPGAGETIASHGATPFGFDVGHHGLVIVSEAGPNAVSTYDLTRRDILDLRSGSVLTDQSATCWVRLTPDERFAYAVNAGSASLTGFDVGPGGRVTPIAGGGATGALPAGAAPLDLDVTEDNRFVFTLEAGSGGIGGFAIAHDGTLTALPGATGVIAPASGAQGLAAF